MILYSRNDSAASSGSKPREASAAEGPVVPSAEKDKAASGSPSGGASGDNAKEEPKVPMASTDLDRESAGDATPEKSEAGAEGEASKAE